MEAFAAKVTSKTGTVIEFDSVSADGTRSERTPGLALRKGALARIDLAGRDVVAGAGSLRWLLPPDAVRG